MCVRQGRVADGSVMSRLLFVRERSQGGWNFVPALVWVQRKCSRTEDPLQVCFYGALWVIVCANRKILSSRKNHGQQISPDRPHKQSRRLGVCVELEKENCIFLLLCPLVPPLSTIHAAAQTILLVTERIWKED